MLIINALYSFKLQHWFDMLPSVDIVNPNGTEERAGQIENKTKLLALECQMIQMRVLIGLCL